jgi:hypothetical protein
MNPYHQALASGLDTYMNMVNAAYQPLKIRSEAASKLAYSQLMGPQFMAKLLGNEHILANTPNPQEKVNSLYDVVQNTNNIANTAQGQGGGGLLDSLSRWYHNSVNKKSPPSGAADNRQSGAPNTFLPPTSSVVIPGQQGTAYQGTGADSGMDYDKNGNNIVSTPNESLRPAAPVSDLGKAAQAWADSPEGKAQAQKEGYLSLPDDKALMDWYNAKQRPDNPTTFAENTANYKNIIEEGKALGTARGKDIQELGEQIEAGYQLKAPFEDLTQIITSPTWQNMRNSIPFFQDKQLKVLAKIGTPEQKKMIGTFIGASQEVVRQTINSFKGTRMKGELTIAQNMKVNEDDAVDVAIGKVKAARIYKDFGTQRASMASQLMINRHMNKGQAIEMADKMLDGNAIRTKIDHEMNPKPTQADIDFMVKKYNKSEDEIKAMLKQRGML